MDFSTIKITSKSTWKQRGFFNHRNYIKKVRGDNVDFLTIEITSKKVRENNVDFSTIELTSKKVLETKWIFRPLKLHRKKYVETAGIFEPSKLHQKSTWKQRGFFDHQNYIDKSRWKKRGFFDHGNFSKKVGGNDMDFSISEITSKKYVEMTWKFVEIWSSTYRRNIHVESTSIRVPVKYLVV